MAAVKEQQQEHEGLTSQPKTTPKSPTIAELRQRFFMDENLNPTTPTHVNAQLQLTTSSQAAPILNSSATLSATTTESINLRSKLKNQLVAKFHYHLEAVNHIRTVYEKPLKKDPKLRGSAGALFGPLKQVRRQYKAVIKYLERNKVLQQGTDDGGYEKHIAAAFAGKLGLGLERALVIFCANHRLVATVELMSQLEERFKTSSPQKQNGSNGSNGSGGSNWSALTLTQLLDAVAGFAGEFPALLDQQLQETPLNTPAYADLERALVAARSMAKNVADVKEIHPNSQNSKKPGFFGLLSRWFRGASRS